MLLTLLHMGPGVLSYIFGFFKEKRECLGAISQTRSLIHMFLKNMHVIYNKTLVSNALTWPVGVSVVCLILSWGAVCGTPTEIGSHSQTKYYYITNSNLVIANLLAKSLL